MTVINIIVKSIFPPFLSCIAHALAHTQFLLFSIFVICAVNGNIVAYCECSCIAEVLYYYDEDCTATTLLQLFNIDSHYFYKKRRRKKIAACFSSSDHFAV